VGGDKKRGITFSIRKLIQEGDFFYEMIFSVFKAKIKEMSKFITKASNGFTKSKLILKSQPNLIIGIE